jgi:hypothetical protein
MAGIFPPYLYNIGDRIVVTKEKHPNFQQEGTIMQLWTGRHLCYGVKFGDAPLRRVDEKDIRLIKAVRFEGQS